jgi:hypothetical protein
VRRRLLIEALDFLAPFLTIRFMTFPSQGMGVEPNRCELDFPDGMKGEPGPPIEMSLNLNGRSRIYPT